MKPIEFHPDAAEEAKMAATHFESVRDGLGGDFQSELDTALARIRDNSLLLCC